MHVPFMFSYPLTCTTYLPQNAFDWVPNPVHPEIPQIDESLYSWAEIADPETTVPEEKGMIASPRPMNPHYFLPRKKWIDTTMIGVVEENRVLDQITGGETVCLLVQTV